ncbi:transposable element Tcb2 transposase [Trichonephila clavipes]|uniref:Transposable element Tcb2 transposase n=1 Tax=Trichonephila clavipes TaxID=2585209 RepID=A0A8X6STF3_TRICX|nr:transposable element Tcb2 transposase [Trichonephila clavipes]
MRQLAYHLYGSAVKSDIRSWGMYQVCNGRYKFAAALGKNLHDSGARVKRNSSTVMQVWKQWIDEYLTPRKTGSGRWKVTSSRNDRHLLRMVVNDRTASSMQLAVRWAMAAGVLMSASSIR